MLFGGVQGLIQDQDWWLRDSNQFCANWNVDPPDEVRRAMNGRGPAHAPQGSMGSIDWDRCDLGGNNNTAASLGWDPKFVTGRAFGNQQSAEGATNYGAVDLDYPR